MLWQYFFSTYIFGGKSIYCHAKILWQLQILPPKLVRCNWLYCIVINLFQLGIFPRISTNLFCLANISLQMSIIAMLIFHGNKLYGHSNILLQYMNVIDEDITPMDTNNTQVDVQGPITRARARLLNLQVSSFLSNYYCDIKNSLLPNDLIVLRNKGEDQQGRGEGLRGVEDQRGRPEHDGGPNRFDFVSVSESNNSPY